MEIKLLEIVLPPEGSGNNRFTEEWIVKTAFPIIVKQERDTKKHIVKSLTDTPAIYMS